MSNNPFDETPDTDRTVIRPTPGGRRTVPAPPVAPARGNPFEPSQDADRTVIRPKPGGVRPPVVAAGAPPQPTRPAASPAAPSIADGTDDIAVGDNPLAAAAAPLLQLLARLRNTANPPDAGTLRERALGELRRFEHRARELSVPMDQLRPAHYALCASLDDVVLNTPWGIEGSWAESPLCRSLHQEARPGEKFFDMVAQLRKKPQQFLPVIELAYLCLSLGFMGRFRQAPRGAAEIDRLRSDLCDVIAAEKPPVQAQLSPQWQGVDAPYRPRKPVLPVWVVAAGALAAIGAVFLFVSTSLNAASDDLYERVLATTPATMPAIARAALAVPPPPPPPPPEPTAVDRLRDALKPDIDHGLVAVLGTASTPVIRLGDKALFASANATLQSSATAILQRVGAALSHEPGAVQVIGYTDNQPIHTIAFPSNFQLSAARAQAVRAALARSIGDPKRLASEGRAEADPIAPNTTPEGREQNRRIELVLHRQDQG